MTRLTLLVLLLLLPSCAPFAVLSDAKQFEAPAVSQPDPGPAPLPAEPVLTPIGLVQPPPAIVETTREALPSLARPVVLAEPPHRSSSAPRPPSPLQLIQESQQGARVGPGSPGYRQVGAMHYYKYEVGAVYDLYVSPTVATGILFPPGDFVKVGLFLPKNNEEGKGGFTVEEKFAGNQAHGYDALTIHPGVEKGEYDAFVLMHNGNVYQFHFIVGKKGMLTVSFDLPTVEGQG